MASTFFIVLGVGFHWLAGNKPERAAGGCFPAMIFWSEDGGRTLAALASGHKPTVTDVQVEHVVLALAVPPVSARDQDLIRSLLFKTVCIDRNYFGKLRKVFMQGGLL